MCHFITAICSTHVNLAEINAVAKNYSLEFEECHNEYITKQLLKTEKYLSKVSKMCDCGTSLGEASSKKQPNDRIKKSEVDKLKRKGWSESKINRYLLDNKKADKSSDELENYVNFIQELFKKSNIGVFGLILHWYSYGIDNENIKIVNRKTVFIKDLTISDLKTVEEDNLFCLIK